MPRTKDSKPHPPLMDRFQSKIMPEPNTGCWLWMGSLYGFGYGSFSVKSKFFAAHRFSYTVHKGIIPKGLCVLHHCDVPSCVNPDHLFLGTNQDNSDDQKKKGRTSINRNPYRGHDHPSSKLSNAQVIKIKELYSNGSHTVRSLGKRFGVSKTLIGFIVTNQRRCI